MTESLQRIKARCDQQGLTSKHSTSLPEGLDVPDGAAKIEGLIIQVPEERDFKNLIVLANDDLGQVEQSRFEKYRFIKGFEAIWSAELRIIECELQSDDALRPPDFVLARVARLMGEDRETDEKTSYELPSPSPNVKIFIGQSSLDFAILSSFKRQALFPPARRINKRLTLRIEGLNVETHNDALAALQKIGNSVLFQIDLTINFPVFLATDRELVRELRAGRRRMALKGVKLSEPRYEYDQEPMSLYWYARAALNMPLLQYLAFYQVMEFYFPVYSYSDTQQRIKNLFKDPTFDINKDTDVAHLLNVIRVSSRGKSFGDEKSQLRATIQSCIDNQALWKFFEDNAERKDFFDVQKKSKSIAKQKISFANSDSDLRAEVSARIYELRCRIVHSKDEEELETLLPFSPEVRNLRFDLELVEYLARKVLIGSSRPLKLAF